MSYADDLKDLMPDSVVWSPFVSRDQFGAPTYGTPTTLRARVVRKHRLVRDISGQQVVSTAQAWIISGDSEIGSTDQVTLPDGTTPVIAAVERQGDEVGGRHTKVMFL